MSRPKVDEMERIKRYLATAPEGILYVVRGWIDLIILTKGGTTPTPARKPRKTKDGAQPKLEGI